VTAEQGRAGVPMLELHDVRLRYANGTEALRGVSLTITAGVVHGLVGANGAGKSTMLAVLSGALAATSGRIAYRGVDISKGWSTQASRNAGISMVYQHVPLVKSLTVLENVYLGREPRIVRRVEQEQRFAAVCDYVGYSINPAMTVGDLRIGDRQMVSILQALASEAELIVLDEPTASLSYAQRDVLFGVIRRLRERGTAVLFVSHFLDELLQLSDEISVLRDGVVVGSGARADWDSDSLVGAVVGQFPVRVQKSLVESAAKTVDVTSRTRLVVRGLRSSRLSVPIDLDVGAGEIVGVVGLVGSGRSELLQTIFGSDDRDDGTVDVDGRVVRGGAGGSVAAGMGLIPEDRASLGLLPTWSIESNISLPALGAISRRFGILDQQRETEMAEDVSRRLAVKADSVHQPVSELSGGNAQKILFAKWLASRSRVYLIDEPTVGVDVGAKAEIHSMIQELAADGAAVLVVSSEFDELIRLVSRFIVLRGGHIVAEMDNVGIDEHDLVAAASGLSIEVGRKAP